MSAQDIPDTFLPRVIAASEMLQQIIASGIRLPLDERVARTDELDKVQQLVTALDRISALTVGLSAVQHRSQISLERLRARGRFSMMGITAFMEETLAIARKDPLRGREMLLLELSAALTLEHPQASRELARRAGELEALRPGDTEMFCGLNNDIDAERWTDAASKLAYLRETLKGSTLRPKAVKEAQRCLLVVQAKYELMGGGAARAEELLRQQLSMDTSSSVVSEFIWFLVQTGQLEKARAAAADAVENTADSPDALLALGGVAEESGDYAYAVESYREALRRLDTMRLERPDAGSLVLMSGLLQRERVVALEESGLLITALEACNAALNQPVRGTELYPETGLFEARARLLRALGMSANLIREADFEAAKRLLWSDRVGEALPLLQSIANGPDGLDLPLAGWYLADALRRQAWKDGSPPDPALIKAAESHWVAWETVGAPPVTEAWVYYSGGNISEDLAYALDRCQNSSWRDRLWIASLRIEKALLSDPRFGDAWATGSRLFNRLGLERMELEYAEMAGSLSPDNAEVQFELARAYLQAGDFGAARKTAVTMQPIEEHAAAVTALRAWLQSRAGDYDGANEIIGGLDPLGLAGWIYDIRASIRAGRGDVLGASEDLRAILDVDFDGSDLSRRRRARAFALLGEPDLARESLGELNLGATRADRQDYWMTCVILGACSSNEEQARRAVSELAGALRTADEVHESIQVCGEASRILGSGPRLASGVEILTAASRWLSEFNPSALITADEELEQAMLRYIDTPIADVALRAVGARRLANANRLEKAASAYTLLVDSPFEPQASSALIEIEQRLLRDAVQCGDVKGAGVLHSKLAGHSPYRSHALAVADALIGADRRDEAIPVLLQSMNDEDPINRALISVQIAELCAWSNDFDGAFAALTRARELSVASGAKDLLVRIVVRLGVLLAAIRGEVAAAEQQFSRCIGIFTERDAHDSEQDAHDPAFLLAFEVRVGVKVMRISDTGGVREAYDNACGAVGLRPSPL